jgi:ethanolamine utilization protein EutA
METIISAGIDIGTSTTQIVFSKITLENTASGFTVPQINIIDKEIIYKSDIYITPLISDDEINSEGLKIILEKEYSKAGISKSEVSTGAVIITGETARKKNAELISKEMSDLAGDFVVASAGPDLEAIIAAKGAGVDKLSKKENALVINFDIGGGTTNISVFDSGEIVDTACFDIGGRLIKLDDQKRVKYVSKKIKNLAAGLNIRLESGRIVKKNELIALAEKMAAILSEVVMAEEKSAEYKKLITNHDLSRKYEADYISFSGGVADYIGKKNYGDNYDKYNDLGIILGKQITESSLYKKNNIFKAEETIRATVVGAGSHTTNISGSTITYTSGIFPIKNIPVIKINESESDTASEFIAAVKRKLDWYGLENDLQPAALAIKGKKNYHFEEITELAELIIEALKDIIESELPLIVILEHDAAKVLGQTLNRMLCQKKNIVSLDGIKIDDGDYIDIGKPLAGGKVLPVIIKTLIFDN